MFRCLTVLTGVYVVMYSCFCRCAQVEVDWEKIQAKIEMEFAKERERAATSSVRSSVSVRR